MKLRYWLLGLFLILGLHHVNTQSEVEFGKNRVQYNDDFETWNQYQTDHFTAYWYGKAQNVGRVAVQLAEMDFEEIQGLIEHQLSERIELIVYTDLTDLKQSNLGTEEAFTNTTGQTKIIGNKMFVHFNGNHKDLHIAVREGIAGVFLNSLYFGSNLQDIVQNAVASDIPEWFIDGLSAYVGESWNHELDAFLRENLGTKLYRDFNDVLYENPKIGGHAFWYFIGQQYGASTISNLLYLTRINRNLESAFLYVLGIPMKTIEAQWLQFFEKRYNTDRRILSAKSPKNPVDIKSKNRVKITDLKMHPSGTMLAYVENEIGRIKVYLYDLINEERKLVFKYGFRNAIQATDDNYPHIAWNPNGLELTLVYDRDDEILISQYDVASEEILEDLLDPQFDRVHSISYRNNVQMYLTATVNGFSDIYAYNTKSLLTRRVTNDYFDDLDAEYVSIGEFEGILFTSNRPDESLERRRLDTILPIDHMDVFFLELGEDENVLTQVTKTPFVSEMAPTTLDSIHYTYLDNDNGIMNRFKGYLKSVLDGYETTIYLTNGEKIVGPRDSLRKVAESLEVDSIVTVPVYKKIAFNRSASNKASDIILQHAVPKRQRLIELTRYEDRYVYNLVRTDSIRPKSSMNTTYKQESIKKLQIASRNTGITQTLEIEEILGDTRYTITDTLDAFYTVVKVDTIYPIDRRYLFQTEFPDPPSNTNRIKIQRDTIFIPVNNETISSNELPFNIEHPPVQRFRPGRIIPYRVKFKTDYVTTKMDNTLLFEGLESYTGPDEEFSTTAAGLLIKTNIKDILEDYQIEVGVRIPTSFDGTEYFAVADNNKKRLDKRVAFYRKAQRRDIDRSGGTPQREFYNILLGQYSVRYPLDVFTSIRGRLTLRNDKTSFFATDQNSLTRPSNNEQRVGLRAEYVFDNTLSYAINILHGTRYKVYAEIQKSFDIETEGKFSLNSRPGTMAILGFDARHYERIAKHSVLAIRAAGATSFGKEKILYYLGGTDNWLIPEFDERISQPGIGGEFVYQTLAANLRGFKRNIRNGNSYALVNAELRIPIFRYFSKRIRSSFFKNFQLVGFADAGTAWQGKSPFSSDNPVNIFTVTSPPLISVDVKSVREPIVAGYGVGARIQLFGYLIRLDYAWGIENKKVQDPKLYLSIGHDF
ncbi:MAG: outer membrane protein assembly factor [Bacteroidia bacterium]|nr:outer membrane protein assembly factor [Bacteroidia bacterium]